MSAATADELETKRAQKNGGDPFEDEETASAAERAEEPEDEPTEDELFPMGSVEGDPKVDWKKLIKAGTPVSLECNLSRAAVPLTQGLYAFGQRGEVLVTFEAGAVKNVPKLGEETATGDRKVDGVSLRQELRAIHVRRADDLYTREQVLDFFAELGVPSNSTKVAELLGD